MEMKVGKLIRIYTTLISKVCSGKRQGFTYDLTFILLQNMNQVTIWYSQVYSLCNYYLSIKTTTLFSQLKYYSQNTDGSKQ